jgi:hypothetical protein
MPTQFSNNFRVLLAKKIIDFSNDVFKIILMKEGFIFNPDTHDLYADVSASEQGNGLGYTAGGATLSGVAVTQNDTDDCAYITWSNPSWTANGGDVGPICGAIIYDDTLVAPNADAIIGFIDFNGSYTEADGGTATIANIKIKL